MHLCVSVCEVCVCLCMCVHGWVCKYGCCYCKVPCAFTLCALWKMDVVQMSFIIVIIIILLYIYLFTTGYVISILAPNTTKIISILLWLALWFYVTYKSVFFTGTTSFWKPLKTKDPKQHKDNASHTAKL